MAARRGGEVCSPALLGSAMTEAEAFGENQGAERFSKLSGLEGTSGSSKRMKINKLNV